MIFLDTNYLVSLYIKTEDHNKRALEIAKTIKNDEKIISKLVVAETINVLYDKLRISKETINNIYEELKNNYTIIEDSYIYDKTLVKIMSSKKRLTFFDLVFVTLMEDLGIEKIASFDKHFDNIEGIVRLH